MAGSVNPGSRADAQGEVGRASEYLASLDGVRAVAIGGVFLLHLDRSHFPGGGFGVDVFFVLSAYLITGNLLVEKDETRTVRFAAFYWRRAFRLLPALVVWVVLFAVPTAVAQHQTHKIPWSAAGALFYFSDFLQAWTHLVAPAFDQSWSLSVEEQFYLVWPALLVGGLLLLRRKPQRSVLAIFVVATLALALAYQSYFLPTGHLLSFALGCWAAHQDHLGLSGWVQRIVRFPYLGVAACAVFAAAALESFTGLANHLAFVAVDLAAAALILRLATDPHVTSSRVLGSGPFRWTGARSYGIYLYGLTIMQLIPALTHLELHDAAPLDIAATAAVAALSYRLVESPIRKRGRAWLRHSTPA